MGVSAQQHRVTTGLYNSKFYVCSHGFNCKLGHKNHTLSEIIILSLATVGLVSYMYIICLLMAMYIDVSKIPTSNYATPPDKVHVNNNIPFWYNAYLCYMSHCIKVIIFFTIKRCNNEGGFASVAVKLLRNSILKCSLLKFSMLYSCWIFMVNIMLLVICNMSILNPGPLCQSKNNISIIYHNVRGFVHFGDLGKVNPALVTTKLLEFQSYVYENKPDIIIINETWLKKSIHSNEILSDQSYKIFRLDRSQKTHPIDINDPDKYRRNGGGVLIAVRSDLDIQTKSITLKCKAEILSIELKLGNGKNICLSTCYRVGTLRDENHGEIENYLNALTRTKKFSKHVLIGDFNLKKTLWPDGNSNVEIENKFINTFNDLGFTQLIEGITHEDGGTLDLLLTNSPDLINNVNILEPNDICTSDHFGLTFNLNVNVKRKKSSKRKIYNFKKANWDALNNDLGRVNWNDKLKFCDVETAWLRFKTSLFELCNKHIPKITIKSDFQPPWFDSDVHRLCREKERWRAKYKKTKNMEHYDKFSQCRRDLKKLVYDKMNTTFNDESDPALISKKFWSHVKSKTNSHRIPETVNYGPRFRNNPKDQADLFNN